MHSNPKIVGSIPGQVKKFYVIVHYDTSAESRCSHTLLRTSIVYYFSTQVAESSTKKYKESKRERRRERDSEREKIDQRPPAFAGTSIASD